MATTLKVLIVEDRPSMRLLVRGLLHAAVRERALLVVEAEDGSQGLERAIQERPDVILSDVDMPVLTGLEMCRLVRSTDATRNIPVIVITSKEEYRETARACGATAFLRKPVHAEELGLILRGLASRAAA